MKEVVLVTGAARGIGRAIAIKLYNDGYRIAAFSRNIELLQELAAGLNDPDNFKIFAGDATDTQFVQNSVAEIENIWGGIDHLINNAGMAIFKKFVDSSLEDFKAQMDVNMYGVYNFTKAVVDGMIANKAGSIFTVSSLAGKNGFVHGTMYAATKHAVMGFSRSLMLELRDYNIRVGTICPGSVDTEMISNTPIEPKNIDKILTGEDVAEIISTMIKLPPRAMVSEIEVRPTNPK